MCRWLAYSGSPIFLKEVLYGGTNSLVDQSLHSRLGAETTNGDGFGVGWYGAPDTPGVYRSTEPAWNDSNLLSSPATSAHRCSSPTSARRSAAPCSRPTATPSGTTAGCAATDGESIWAFRYSSERKSRTLFYTTDVPTLRELQPDRQLLNEFSDDARLIVSEPLGDVAGVWNEVPESSCCIVRQDDADLRPFRPTPPSTPVPVVA